MIRMLSALFLTLALAVTSVSQAVARGQDAGLTEMVICANGLAVSVHVDAAGNIADPPHHCPDCLLALAPADPAPRLPQPAVLSRDAVTGLCAPQDAPCTAPRAAAPRGPPALS